MSANLETCLDWVRENLGELVMVRRVSTINVVIGKYRVWAGGPPGSRSGIWLVQPLDEKAPRNDAATAAEAVSLAIGYAVSDAFDEAMGD